MRQLFGAGIGDFVVLPVDGTWGVGAAREVTFWDSAVDGARYTDLLDGTGAAVEAVTSDEHGAIPRFQGPHGVTGMWADAGGPRAWMDAHVDASQRESSKAVVVTAPGPGSWVIWRAPSPGTITAVRGYRVGGTGLTVNATRNGSDLLPTDLSLSVADTWLAGPELQGATFDTGDAFAVAVRSVSGAPSAVTIQLDIRGL
ncbi:hypothetical protein [Streptomyces sp. SHP 1-2]|uniref:hypothetical protein n=1 Tax=Streptomyces sp. SHP 1-2 TaxID=2769489 RepID=UPI002237D06A|nr:hypothetical protein [Streptomyces sp. SHP 1-2]MCW5252206.1 hypothetical protein [Streptomyces sp. SHP 1-2]